MEGDVKSRRNVVCQERQNLSLATPYETGVNNRREFFIVTHNCFYRLSNCLITLINTPNSFFGKAWNITFEEGKWFVTSVEEQDSDNFYGDESGKPQTDDEDASSFTDDHATEWSVSKATDDALPKVNSADGTDVDQVEGTDFVFQSTATSPRTDSRSPSSDREDTVSPPTIVQCQTLLIPESTGYSPTTPSPPSSPPPHRTKSVSPELVCEDIKGEDQFELKCIVALSLEPDNCLFRVRYASPAYSHYTNDDWYPPADVPFQLRFDWLFEDGNDSKLDLTAEQIDACLVEERQTL